LNRFYLVTVLDIDIDIVTVLDIDIVTVLDIDIVTFTVLDIVTVLDIDIDIVTVLDIDIVTVLDIDIDCSFKTVGWFSYNYSVLHICKFFNCFASIFTIAINICKSKCFH